MGLFDTIKMGIPCPKCEKICNDFQTKELYKGLGTYKPGDKVDAKFRWISALGDCPHCSTKKVIVCSKCKQIHDTGKTHYFHVKIFINDDGVITPRFEYEKTGKSV